MIVDQEKFNWGVIEGFMMILGFNQQHNKTQFASTGQHALQVIKQGFDSGEYHQFSLIVMYLDKDSSSDLLDTAKSIR